MKKTKKALGSKLLLLLPKDLRAVHHVMIAFRST